MLAVGGAGHVSATANILPREVAELYNLVVAGRWNEAIDLHYQLLPLNEVLFLETNPSPLKWAMGRIGQITPTLRLPLCEPSLENQVRIETVLSNYQLLPQKETRA
jgi:4-hydroxy-tetrahydrodipicolinate synthase